MGKEKSRIRRLREERGLTGVEVANRLGVSPQYYYAIERTGKTPSVQRSKELAEIFQVSLDTLLSVEPPAPPKHRIREIRKRSGMNGSTVASKLNISPQHYYNLERGDRTLTVEHAEQLAEIFQVNIDDLLGENRSIAPQEEHPDKNVTPGQEVPQDDLYSSFLSFFEDLSYTPGEDQNKGEKEVARPNKNNNIDHLQEMVNALKNKDGYFEGILIKDMPDDDRKLLISSLENSLLIAKKLAKDTNRE